MAEPIIRWIQIHRRWHAWAHGARKSVCGSLNVESLRARPPRAIEATVQPEYELCRLCARAARIEASPREQATNATLAWLGYLKRYVRHLHAIAPETSLRGLAERLSAEVGAPDSREAARVFEEVRWLILRPKRRSDGGKQFVQMDGLKEAVESLGARPDALRHLATGLSAWRRVTNKSPGQDRIVPERVISTMLAIDDVEGYARRMHARDFSHLGAMFHPNTLAVARKDGSMRGVFAGSGEYWSSTSDQLNVVRD